MKLSAFLKDLFVTMVDSYRKEFLRTLGTSFMFTLLCFGMVILCLHFSDFEPDRVHSPSSLISYFFFSYSLHDTYCLADIAPVLFLFVYALCKSHWNRKFRLTLKAVGFAFLAYMILRTLSYEFYEYVRIYLLNLILLQASEEKKFIFESMLGTGIITMFFPGYFAVMSSVSKMIADIKLSGGALPEF